MSQANPVKFKSIRDKFVSLNTRLLMFIVSAIVIATVSMTYYGITKSFSQLENQIKDNLLSRGFTLVNSSSLALVGMAEDYAFESVRELVSSTVKSSPEITYGIYMDSGRQPWVFSNADNIEGSITEKIVLDDEAAIWASSISDFSHKQFQKPGSTQYTIEFAGPVSSDFEQLGTIRYGIDPSATKAAIDETKSTMINSVYIFVAVLVAIGFILVGIGNRLNMRQADSITTPLENLTKAANSIALGNYSEEVTATSDDEVGLLAMDFEIMRKTIQEYTATLEQKVKERTAQLEEAQKEALENAHKAGMADVATGTLHNVGNILNSVVVSTASIQDMLGESKTKGLTRANDLLSQNIKALDEFILHDPKGPKLMEYYLSIGQDIEEEYNELRHQTNRLHEKVHVIIEAISAQQAYAGFSAGMLEQIDLEKLIDDAITINSGSLSKYSISIRKEYQNPSLILAQKNKVMQILVNLITNSKDAMIDTPADQRALTFSIELEPEEAILRVTDTGHGISADNLKKIFNHGFSTKTTGHGFGLHSCANYMTEMGGSMWCESEGEGKGSTFILKLQRPQSDS